MVAWMIALALQPQAMPAPPYAARFDCQVQSTIGGRSDDGPHQVIVTVANWQIGTEQPMVEMNLPDGRAIRHPGTIYRVRASEGGALAVAINSTAFIWLTRERADSPARFRSLYFFHHGVDPEETSGPCTLDLRQPPVDGAMPEGEAG